MDDGHEDRRHDRSDIPGAKRFDIAKLKIDGVPKPETCNALKKAVDDMGHATHPFRGMQDRLTPEIERLSAVQEVMKRTIGPIQEIQDRLSPEMERISAVQEAMKRSLGPFRDLQGRMDSLGLAAGAGSALGRLAEQIGAQQHAIDALRFQEPEPPCLPELPENPIIETNRRLERIEEQFEQIRGIAAEAAQIANGLQAAAAEFLQKFEKAATDNDRTAGRAIRIGIVAVIIAVAMPAAQILYSEYRREPSNGPEMRAALQELQTELSTMRDADAATSDSLAATLASLDGAIAAVLQDIQGLLSQETASPEPMAQESPQ